MNADFKIKENSFIARMAALKLGVKQVAIVIGRTIHLHQTDKKSFLDNKAWLRHELKHIEQFHRYGFLPFIFLYLWESVRHGYYNNRFEREARAAETDSHLKG